MLVLSRKPGEQIAIGRDIVLVVVAVQGARVTLGLSAPRSVAIRRTELPPLGGESPPHDPEQAESLLDLDLAGSASRR